MPTNSTRNANGQWGRSVPRRSSQGPKKVHQEKGSKKNRKRKIDDGVADIECDSSNGSNSLVRQQHSDDILQGSSIPAPTGGGINDLSISDNTFLSSTILEDIIAGSPLFSPTQSSKSGLDAAAASENVVSLNTGAGSGYGSSPARSAQRNDLENYCSGNLFPNTTPRKRICINRLSANHSLYGGGVLTSSNIFDSGWRHNKSKQWINAPDYIPEKLSSFFEGGDEDKEVRTAADALHLNWGDRYGENTGDGISDEDMQLCADAITKPNYPSKRNKDDTSRALDACMNISLALSRATNYEEVKSILVIRDAVHQETNRLHSKFSDKFEDNQRPFETNAELKKKGLYSMDKGYMKIGTGNLKERAKQDNFFKSVIAYDNELEKMDLVSSSAIDAVLGVGSPMLNGHHSSKLHLTRTKVASQFAEGSFYGCYNLEENNILEFVLQMPTELLRKVSSITATSFVENNRDNLAMAKKLIDNAEATGVFFADTWASPISNLRMNNQYIEHLLPPDGEQVPVTIYQCKQSVTTDCFGGFEDLHPDSPYLKRIMPFINSMLDLVLSGKADKAALLSNLIKIKECEPFEAPSKSKKNNVYGRIALQNMIRLVESKTTKNKLILTRNDAMEAMKEYNTQLFNESFEVVIEFKCSKFDARSEPGLLVIGGRNKITMYKSKTNRLILSRRSSYKIFDPLHTKREEIFHHTRGYVDECIILYEMGFQSLERLQGIEAQMLSHSMSVSGLNGSIHKANGSVHEGRNFVLPSYVGGKAAPAGFGSIQKKFGVYWLAVVAIYQAFHKADPSNEAFNKVKSILSEDKSHLNGTSMSIEWLEKRLSSTNPKKAKKAVKAENKKKKVAKMKSNREKAETSAIKTKNTKAERDVATHKACIQPTVSAIMSKLAEDIELNMTNNYTLARTMRANGYNQHQSNNPSLQDDIRQQVKTRKQIMIGMNKTAKVLIYHHSATHKVDLNENSSFLTEVMKICGLVSFVQNKEIRKSIIGLVKSHLK